MMILPIFCRKNLIDAIVLPTKILNRNIEAI